MYALVLEWERAERASGPEWGERCPGRGSGGWEQGARLA